MENQKVMATIVVEDFGTIEVELYPDIYIIYEKSKHKVWIYLCPCILTILLVWNTATRFGWTQYQEFIPAALTVGLYTLFIFAASHFSAPPERE